MRSFSLTEFAAPCTQKFAEREVLAGLVSSESRFRLLIAGPFDRFELDQLIQKLVLEREIMAGRTAARASRATEPGAGSSIETPCGSAEGGAPEAADAPDAGEAIVRSIPGLRAFGIALCGDGTKADELVKDIVIDAWNARETLGVDYKLKLYARLRDAVSSQARQSRRNRKSSQLPVGEPPSDRDDDELSTFRKTLDRLPLDQREAFVLVGAEGFSCEEAALISGCAVGTIKSRLHRARARLAESLSLPERADATSPPVSDADQEGQTLFQDGASVSTAKTAA